MFGYGDMKGWQAVPIVIPSVLLVTIGIIWYFTFHHYKDRPGNQQLTTTMTTTTRPSQPSQDSAVVTSDVNSQARSPVVRLVDIPAPPTKPSKTQQKQFGQVRQMENTLEDCFLTSLCSVKPPDAALKAGRSKESITLTQSGRLAGANRSRSIVSSAKSYGLCNQLNDYRLYNAENALSSVDDSVCGVI